MLSTGNPGGVGHAWVKRRFVSAAPAGDTIRREASYENPVTGETVTAERSACFVKSLVFDNPELIRNSPSYVPALASLPERERRRFLEGDWDVLDDGYFDGASISVRLTQIYGLPRRGYDFVGGKPEFCEGGSCVMFAEPQPGRAYVIGADPAGGGVDFFAFSVLDAVTLEQMTTYRRERGEDEFLDALAAASRLYNGAAVAVETNFNGYFAEVLQQRSVPQYVREVHDSYTGATERRYGFSTNARTRPIMLSEMKNALESETSERGYGVIRDRLLLGEMANFVRNERTGKWEAAAGSRDDLIMSFALAVQAAHSGQARYRAAPDTVDTAGWTERMRRIYYGAPETARAALLDKWSNDGSLARAASNVKGRK
jgi:phage terminase large subunit